MPVFAKVPYLQLVSFFYFFNDLFGTFSPVDSFALDATLHCPLSYRTLRHKNTNVDRDCNVVGVSVNSDLELIFWGTRNYVGFNALKLLFSLFSLNIICLLLTSVLIQLVCASRSRISTLGLPII